MLGDFMAVQNNNVGKMQLLGRLALVTGLLVACVLIFADFGSARLPAGGADLPESDQQLVSLLRPLPMARPNPSVGTRPIQSIRVGERVMAHNPEVSDDERVSWAEPNWSDWLHLSLVMPIGGSSDDGLELNIELLRPESWVLEQVSYLVDDRDSSVRGKTSTVIAAPGSSSQLVSPRFQTEFVPLSPLRPIYRELSLTAALLNEFEIELVGLAVEMDLPEMGATGTAVVTDIRSCPAVRPGDGQPVTATFSHPPANAVLDVLFEGESEPIGVTDNHLFWSVDRQQFLAIGKMKLGEHVQTFHGDTKRIEQKLARPGPQAVYNLEVYGEHVYFVGEQGLLAHNSYSLNAPNPAARRAYLNEKFGRTGNLDVDINTRAGITPRTARAAEQLGNTGENAAVLRRNLALEGRPVGAGEAAGHLVPSTGSQGHWAAGARARQLLQHYNVRINSGANGIPIGHPRPHNLTHRGAFLRDLETRLNGVAESMRNQGRGHGATRSALQRELRVIGSEVPRQ